jgi:hypothetical protein
VALIASGVASSASAVDGVLEINQACAAGAGCFTGDTAGFPVQISSRGSYRLTGNLTPPNQNTNLFEITAAAVSLDLNGFTIAGTNNFTGPNGGSCSASGSGIGVHGSANDVVVANGDVRGMGSHGIDLGTASAGARVERVIAVDNCGIGIRVPLTSSVHDSVALENGSHGIVGGAGSRVSDCVAHRNGSEGIRSSADTGALAVEGSVSTTNGGDGIFGGSRSAIIGCVGSDNFDDGIEAQVNSQVLESIANRNSDRGVTVAGDPANGTATVIGLIEATGNLGTAISGGTRIGCTESNLDPKQCP